VLIQTLQAVQYLLLDLSNQKNRILNLLPPQKVVHILPHSSTQFPTLPASPINSASTLPHFKMIVAMTTISIHGNVLDTREGIQFN
jgi:hypothetical protein